MTDARRFVTTAVLALLLALGGLAPAQANQAVGDFSVGEPTTAWFFQASPTDYHQIDVGFSYSATAPVTAGTFEIRSPSGELVHTAQPTHTPHSSSSGYSGYWSIPWDGKRDGVILPGGTYTMTSTMSDGSHTISATAPLYLEAIPPATVTVQQTGTPNVQDVVATPPDDVDLRACNVRLDPSWPVLTWTGRMQADGTCITRVDLSSRPAGTAKLVFQVSRWTPNHSYYRPYAPPSQTVTVVDSGAPVVAAPGDATAYRASATTYETKRLTYTVSDNSQVSGEAWVSNASGTTVRGSLPIDGWPTFEWNGTGDDGDLLPVGTYAVHARFTDSLGNATEAAPVAVTLVEAHPGDLAAPVDGSTLEGEVPFDYIPAAGSDVRQVVVRLTDDAAPQGTLDGLFYDRTISAADADGHWRLRWPVGDVEGGSYTLESWVTWADPGGAAHVHRSDTRHVTVDPVTIPLEVETTATGPLTADVAIEASSPRSEPLEVTIDWGDGTTPESHTISTPYQADTGRSHAYARGGTYSPRVTVTGSDTSSTATDSVTLEGSSETTPTPTPEPTPTPTAAPAAPTKVAATAASHQVTLTWAPSTGAESYQVIVTTGTTTRSLLTSATSLKLTGLTNGTRLAFVVRAGNAKGWSPWSSKVTATPNALPPVVATVTGEARTHAALIRWTAGTVTSRYGPPTGFKVQIYRSSLGRWSTVRTTAASTRSWLQTDLRAGKTYRFRVVAINAVGAAAPSTTVKVTPHR